VLYYLVCILYHSLRVHSTYVSACMHVQAAELNVDCRHLCVSVKCSYVYSARFFLSFRPCNIRMTACIVNAPLIQWHATYCMHVQLTIVVLPSMLGVHVDPLGTSAWNTVVVVSSTFAHKRIATSTRRAFTYACINTSKTVCLPYPTHRSRTVITD
jgi:hypothetical protein